MSVSYSLQDALYEQWKNEEHTDLQVVVGGTEFKCHSLILCTYSDFFKAMMRSNMKESQEGVVHLQGIAAETFSVLLESMYRDFIDLTNENVLDVMYASCQLQINSVMEKCESYVIDHYVTAENCVLLYFHAKHLSAKKIVEKALDCICHNFEQVIETDSFLDASYDDVFYIINSEELKVKSEDSVIEFILKWVCHIEENTVITLDENSSNNTNNQDNEAHGQAYEVNDTAVADQYETETVMQTMEGSNVEALAKPTDEMADIHDSSSTGCTQEENVAEDMTRNDQHMVEREDISETQTRSNVKLQKYHRAKYLLNLLSSARICLANKHSLEKLLKHELVKTQREVYNSVFEALLYKLDVGRRHGSWPQTAIHRRTSSMKHAMVYVQRNSSLYQYITYQVMAYDLDEGSVSNCTTIPISKETCENITMFDNNLLVGIYSYDEGHKIKLYNITGGWHNVGPGGSRIGSNARSLLAHDHYIYRGKENGHFLHGLERLDITSATGDLWSSPPFVVYQSRPIDSVVPFGQYIIAFWFGGIIVMDTVSEGNIQVPSIGGPMHKIISINDHENTYILQGNGSLWKILLSDTEPRVKFEFVAKLWNTFLELHGGIYYKGTLFIFGNEESAQGNADVRQTCVPGVFENIKYVFISSLTKCVPMIISK